MKKLLFVLGLFLNVAFLAGCESKTTEQKEETTTTTEAPGTTNTAEELAYICPMKCEGSASQEPGKCKVCGMDLVKNPGHIETATDSTQVN